MWGRGVHQDGTARWSNPVNPASTHIDKPLASARRRIQDSLGAIGHEAFAPAA
jgi:hypothetical protein